MEIFISKISNYYYIFTSEDLYDENETNQWKFLNYSAKHKLDKKSLLYLRRILKNMGLKRLSRKMAHIEIPFIETELLPREGHRLEIFNCLFSDIEVDYY